MIYYSSPNTRDGIQRIELYCQQSRNPEGKFHRSKVHLFIQFALPLAVVKAMDCGGIPALRALRQKSLRALRQKSLILQKK